MEHLLLQAPRGAVSRLRLLGYRLLGMRMGARNRFEGGGRVRRCSQIQLGSRNEFTQGCWLWPEDSDSDATRIRIGDGNYFNRHLMIEAGALVQIGDHNLFGPDVYITDTNHAYGPGIAPGTRLEKAGVVIGNRCWIGARATILMGVRLGDGCVVGAGAVVTRSVAAGEAVVGVPAHPIRPADEAGRQFARLR